MMNTQTGAIKIVGSPRSNASQVEAKWVDAEEICHMMGGISKERLLETMYQHGLVCKESHKPTDLSYKKGVARIFHHGGKDIYKWNKRFIREELDDLSR